MTDLNLDWNDWRAFLATARGRSTLAAARTMNVSQSTVSRRITALETALGLMLFERSRDGSSLTDAGKRLVEHAEAIETATSAAQCVASSFARQAKGVVKVTAGEVFANLWVTPALADFRAHHPSIMIEIDTSDEFRDLTAGEADVALRSTWDFDDPCLVGRRLCDEDWTFYASHGYVGQRGLPTSVAELQGHALLGGGGSAWPAYEKWLKRNDLLDSVVFHHRSIAGLMAAVREGFGLSALPCWIAEFDHNLVRCFPPPRSGRGLWLLCPEAKCRQPHVRNVVDHLYVKLTARIEATQPWPIRVDLITCAPSKSPSS